MYDLNMLRNGLLWTLLCFLPFTGSSQSSQKVERFNAFGIQYRPILAAPLFNTGPIEGGNEEFNATLNPELGHDFGVVLRWGIGEKVALETGIDQIRRNFSIHVEDRKSSFEQKLRFNMLAYQLPLRGLLYVKIGERLFSNIAVGAVADIFPTDWEVAQGRVSQFTQRYNWLVGAFSGNLGLEYRSEESGSFYLGATYHRPLGNAPALSANVAAMEIRYKRDKKLHRQTIRVPGNYITVDLKYFFPH